MLQLMQDRRDHRVLPDLKAHKDQLEPKDQEERGQGHLDQKETRVTGDPRAIQRQNHWVL